MITTTLRKQALMGWWWASACLLSNMRQRVQLQLMSCSDYCGGGIWFPAAKACTGHSVAPAISAMRIFSAFKCECYSFSGNATNPAQDQRKAVHWPGIEPGPPAWQARILPLNHQCMGVHSLGFPENTYCDILRGWAISKGTKECISPSGN